MRVCSFLILFWINAAIPASNSYTYRKQTVCFSAAGGEDIPFLFNACYLKYINSSHFIMPL